MKIKQRGLKRKCAGFIRRITEETETFPQPHDGDGYWHLHLPVGRDFIHSASTRTGIRRLCVQTLINRAQHLVSIAPPGTPPVRVVVAVSWPDFWPSQIIIFFNPEYFDNFFSRNTEAQCWTRLPQNRSLIHEWNISIPDEFSECGYLEEINDEDDNYKGEMWFIGQLTAG